MSLSVMLGLATVSALGATWWGRAVLVDEERYLRAVSNLAASRRFGRVAGWSASLAARHHQGWRRGVSPRAARLIGLATRRTMGSRAFGRAWTVGHRWIHRGRGPDRRLAAAMLALAATGELVGAANRARRRVGPRLRPGLSR